MKLKSTIFLLFVCLYIQNVYAQSSLEYPKNKIVGVTKFINTDSGLLIINFIKADCKFINEEIGFIPNLINTTVVKIPVTTKENTKPKFLTVHGNVSYDYFYRSKIDTPFAQQNLQQHTERVWLDVLIKEKYPFKVGFTARQSNSPFFKDLYNTNINFDKYNYTKRLKQELLDNLTKFQWEAPNLKLLDTALKYELQKYQALKLSFSTPDMLQKLIEKKEEIYYKKIKEQEFPTLNDSITFPSFDKTVFTGKFDALKHQKDSILNKKNKIELPNTDSLQEAKIKLLKNRLDSLQNNISKLTKQKDSIKNNINKKLAASKQLIYKAKTPKELEKIALQEGISEPKKEKLQNFLADVKSFGIGRSMVDYTELTAKNVMLTGVNAEYNPSYYAAFAAGKIDYGFRNFLGKSNNQPNQYLTLARFGWGNTDKRSVILTVFNGKKSNYSGQLAGGNDNAGLKLFGYSLETIIKKNENTSMSFEVAKSTKYNHAVSATDSSKAENLFKYSDYSNLGISIKAQTIIPETNTLISGFYRSTGNQFQSFSLFTFNTNQKAWQLRADQSFLKRKINFTAMLRQNDFTNPLTEKTFKTTTVFKSFQVNVKIPRWPIINAGYYPGSQFYLIDENRIRESVYYILNGSLLYPYKFKDISMSSSVMYNRYFNKSTDSGFVFYKGINYSVNQSIQINKVQAQGAYSYNNQADIKYYTLDANGDYSFKKVFKIGGGIKYNHVLSGENYWGRTIRIGGDFKQFGGLQLSYEKSYLPTIQQTLTQVEIGRLSWYKFF